MMNPKELRIGNLVHFEDWTQGWFDGKISSINNNSVTLDNKTLADIDANINPIPITEDWLKKFGFNKYDSLTWGDQYKFSYNFGYKKLFISDSEGDPDCPISVNIEHIHQLQNLYFLMTGEELEIK